MIRLLSTVGAALALSGALAVPAPAQQDPAPAQPRAAARIEPIRLPGEGRVRGFACSGDVLWLVRDGLLVLTADERRLVKTLPAPEGLLGLAGDDRSFYVLERAAIVVMDRVAVREVRRIGLKYDGKHQPVAIGAHRGELIVAWPDRLVAVDKRTGEQRKCAPAFVRPRWLASDGEALWAAGLEVFGRVGTAAETKQWEPHELAMSFEGRLATFVGGRLLLVQNHLGQRAGSRGVICPEERLTIEVVRGDRGLLCQCGPKPLRDVRAMAQELERIAALPSAMVAGVDGERVLLPVLVYANDEVDAAELAEVVEVARKAGFGDVNCADVEARPVEQSPPPPQPPGKRNAGK